MLTDIKEEVYLTRLRRSDQGTEGKILYNGFSCFTLELPWRNNSRGRSCIPVGEYKTITVNSNKYSLIYWVTNVEERSGILIHWGNFAGDTSKGFKSHSMGCILLGKSFGYLGGQKAILNSRVTVYEFMRFMNYEPFILHVLEEF